VKPLANAGGFFCAGERARRIVHLMKTDVLFYSLFQRMPEIFFYLIGAPVGQAEGYRLEALEIKQTSYRMDGIFRPNPDDPGRPIYFTEVQFQPNERFYQRLFARIFDYCDQQEAARRWYVRVVFADRSMDPGLPSEFQGVFVPGLLERFYLDDLRGQANLPVHLELIRLIVIPDAEAEAEAQRLLRRVRDETEPGKRRQEMVESAETVIVYRFPHLGREELEHMFELVDLKETRFYQDAFADGEQEGVKKGVQQGVKKGVQEGVKKGEHKGRLDAVPLLMEMGASVERIAEELGLAPEAVRKAAECSANRRKQALRKLSATE
jgi:predicted transposase/invertase (TIGR01784 family)